MLRQTILTASVMSLIAFAFAPLAEAGRHRCNKCGQTCVTYQTVEKTVMVPSTVMEKRTVDCVKYRPEVSECQVTVMERVPVTKTVTRLCTVMVSERHMRTECYTVCKPTYEQVTREYCGLVSEPVVKQGVRTVCKPVYSTEKRVVCEDQGEWGVDKNGCKCWIPNVVEKEIEVTVCKTETVEEPYEYTVMVCRPEKRTATVNVCKYEYEQRTREVPYTVCVPQKVEKQFKVTTYKCVPVERTKRTVTMVPYKSTKEILVPVCQMVPKTVVCKVPVCCN